MFRNHPVTGVGPLVDVARRSVGAASGTPRLQPPDTVPTMLGHVGLCAQRQPDLTRIDTGGEGVDTRAAADGGQHEIGQQ